MLANLLIRRKVSLLIYEAKIYKPNIKMISNKSTN